MRPAGPSTGILTGHARRAGLAQIEPLTGGAGLAQIEPLTCDRAPLDIHQNAPKILDMVTVAADFEAIFPR
jgi:hypothetical protein